MKFIRKFFNRKSQKSRYSLDLYGRPTFDLRDLFLLAEDNTEYTILLLELFLDNAEKGLKQLQLACELHNWEQASALAHKLMPGCKQLHISQLIWVLQQIETQASDNPDALSLKTLSNQALYSYYQVKKMMEEELGNLKSNRIPV